jgi:hypothetical protein
MITAPIPQSFRFRPIDDEMPNFDNTFDAARCSYNNDDSNL